MINLSIGGRYCSMITVDGGKAFVLERKMAKTATAGPSMRIFIRMIKNGANRRSQMIRESSAHSIPKFSDMMLSDERQSCGELWYLSSVGVTPVDFLESYPSAEIMIGLGGGTA